MPVQNETTTVVIPPVQRQAPPPQVQTQSANAVNVQNSGNVGTTPSEPEMLPISRFERINYVAPEYPRAARRRNITGSVDLTFTITTDGRVRAVSVLKSEPGELLELRITSDAFEAISRYDMHAHGSTTHLTHTMYADYRGIVRIMAPLVRGQAQQQIADDLVRLKELVETDSP